MFLVCLVAVSAVFPAFGQAPGSSRTIDIQTARGDPEEIQTKLVLQALVRKYDVSKYTSTNQVVIERGAMNHSFPVITLNVRFRDQSDVLLLSLIHEQLHWYLRDRNAQRVSAIAALQRLYPNAPIAYPEGGGSAESTYEHLIVCYLDMQAGRQLLGEKKTRKAIDQIPWYGWIWKTVLNDEATIAAVVAEQHLEIP